MVVLVSKDHHVRQCRSHGAEDRSCPVNPVIKPLAVYQCRPKRSCRVHRGASKWHGNQMVDEYYDTDSCRTQRYISALVDHRCENREYEEERQNHFYDQSIARRNVQGLHTEFRNDPNELTEYIYGKCGSDQLAEDERKTAYDSGITRDDRGDRDRRIQMGTRNSPDHLHAKKYAQPVPEGD